MKTLLCGAALFCSAIGFGQASAPDATALAKARTAQLTTDLGLNAKQATAVEEMMVAAEMQLVGERAKCAEIQSTIDATMKKSYTRMEGILTPEQVKKLKTLPVNSCAGHAGCSHEAKASAGCAKDGAKAGCCAGGKAGAQGTGSTTPAKMEPMKTTIN